MRLPRYLIPVFIFIIFAFLIVFSNIFSHEQRPLDTSQSGKYNQNNKTAIFHGKKFIVPNEIVSDQNLAIVLGKNTDKKRIEIDLSEQKLRAYEGDNKVFSFKVSTGKWGRTPTGKFRIWTKMRYSLMAGGSQALGTYYYLPNVPYVMYFANGEIPASQGFGIHGTYWHNNFGHPMSHGCINMKTEEAEQLFHWANPVLPKGAYSVLASDDNSGTRVIIYGEAPND